MLQNRNTYESCFCHSDEEYPVVEYREFPEAVAKTVQIFHQEIVFVTRGSVHVSTGMDPAGRTLGEWEFIFVPMGKSLSYMAAAGSAILIARMTSPVPECHVFRIDKIAEPLPPGEFDGRIYPLTAGERMRHDIEGLIAKLGDGFLCRNYLQTIVVGLLYVLHAYHTREECIRFFSAVISPDLEFSEFVRLNWVQLQSADSLAAAMNMPFHRFLSRFQSVFGVSPHHWLAREKARSIYREICTSGKPLKEIAITYGFTDRSNFFRYCIRNYGSRPGDIRKSLTAGPAKIPEGVPEYAIN
jgi:AraC-like DNA-binding protein